MATVEELSSLLAKLDPVQREELLLSLVKDKPDYHPSLFPLVDRVGSLDWPAVVATPGVCGGAARLIRTRIPVWTLEQMRRLGVSEADILRNFPVLRAADLVQACSYSAAHADEIDKAIRENEVG